MNSQILSVNHNDQPELLALMTRTIRTSVTQEIDLQNSYIKNVTKNLEAWAANPDQNCHLKAVKNETIVGVILIRKFWNLCSLFVDPECHRQGIGRTLVMSAVEVCRAKSDKLTIYMNAAPNAIAFYRTLGCIPRESNQTLTPGIKPMQLIL